MIESEKQSGQFTILLSSLVLGFLDDLNDEPDIKSQFRNYVPQFLGRVWSKVFSEEVQFSLTAALQEQPELQPALPLNCR